MINVRDKELLIRFGKHLRSVRKTVGFSQEKLANEADISAVSFKDVPTHADIASRISTHREAVTRELKSLEKLGVIDWRPGNYVVHDVTALEALAQNP